MAQVDPKVMSAVEAAIKANPDTTVDELLALATKVNPATAELSKRQFHARYPLQVKRRMRPPRKRRRRQNRGAGRPAENGSARDAVRSEFLKFASDLAAAEERKELVKVVGGVDEYVEEVMGATRR